MNHQKKMTSINKPGTFAESLEEKLSLPFMEAGTDNMGRVEDVAGICKEKTGKAKFQLELNLLTVVKQNMKLFYKYLTKVSSVDFGS